MSDEPSQNPMSEPQRQSLLGVAVYFLRNFRAMITLFIAFFAAASSSAWFWSIVALAALPVLIIFGVLSYYQYLNFTFQVSEDELIIHKGVIFTERIVVDIDRIQSINITENLIQRILGLVALKVDTAGSKGSELEIPALESKRAKALKELLYSKKEAQTGDVRHRDEQHDAVSAGAADDNTKKKVLVRLGIKDLVVVGLTENHLRTGLVAVAFLFGTISQYQQMLESYMDESVDAYAEQAIQSGFKIMLLLIVLFVVVSILISIFRAVLQFYNLKAVLRSDAVEISTGLIKRNSFRVPIRKVQYVKWESNPLRRWVGFESAKLKPSSSAGETSKKQRIEIPALRLEQSQTLARGLFSDYAMPGFSILPDARAYGRFAAILTAVISLPALATLYFQFGIWSVWILILIPLAAILGYRYGKSVKLHFDPDFLVIRKGWVFTKRMVMPTYKIQALSIHQNVFIARRRLCHLRIFTAAGELSVRYLPADDARRLYDFMLYRVESSEESWM